MNYIFVSTGKYPDQHAAAIRHSTIAKAMFEMGHEITFFVLTNQDWQNKELFYKGVNFISLNNYKGKNKFLKIFHFFNSLFNLKKEIFLITNKKTIDAIVVYSIENVVLNVLFRIARNKKIKIFHERTELPNIVDKTDSIIGKIKYYIYLNYLIPKFNGIFVISDKLIDFFLPYNKNIFKILTVVDTDFFINTSKSNFSFPYIAYCGTMSGTKDGVPILIESFAKLSPNFTEIKLLLIGNNLNKVAIKDTLDAIEFFKIQDKVIFTGLVERDEMPSLLGNAKLLVLSKPDNEQNSGNFPIKIGEYLATGVPVVVTKVGEIHNFITDGFNGYLAEPDSIQSFYLKMEEALLNYERAQVIGNNGKIVVEKIFDSKIQSHKMVVYMNKVNKDNHGS